MHIAVFAVFIAVAAAAAAPGTAPAQDLAQDHARLAGPGREEGGAPLASLVVPPAHIARHSSSSHRAARMLGGEAEFVDVQHGPGGVVDHDDPHHKRQVIPFVDGKDADFSGDGGNVYGILERKTGDLQHSSSPPFAD